MWISDRFLRFVDRTGLNLGSVLHDSEYTKRGTHLQVVNSTSRLMLDAVRTDGSYSGTMAKKSYLKVINMKTLGAAGGKARAAKLSARQRKAAARNAANARWDAERERKAGVA